MKTKTTDLDKKIAQLLHELSLATLERYQRHRQGKTQSREWKKMAAICDQVAKNHNVIVTDMAKRRRYWIKTIGVDSVFNYSYCAGREIMLGIYADNEKKFISFFHELGHQLLSHRWIKKHYHSKMRLEMEAWKRGLAVAEKIGIRFSDHALLFALDCVRSYAHWNERECSNHPKSVLVLPKKPKPLVPSAAIKAVKEE